jgi:putative aminopeptidase FrvX
MNLDFLKEVLSLPSISGDESMVRDYIIEYAKTKGIDYYTDKKGNLYLTKGMLDSTDEYFPCVVSHMDTVHRTHRNLIENKVRLTIKEDNLGVLTAHHPETDKQTGIGGDDKCGVYVCLELFNNFDKLKGAFFVEEEIGMLGSKESDDRFFENVGYAIQFDAPSSNWITEICSGVKLFDEDFKTEIKGVLNESGYNKFSIDPFTDVNQLAKKYDFNCLNLGCGYYKQHSDSEYVVISEVEDSLKAGVELINKLGVTKYVHKKTVVKPIVNETHRYGLSSQFDEFDDDPFADEFDEMGAEVSEMVITMFIGGIGEKDIYEEVSKYLRDYYANY